MEPRNCNTCGELYQPERKTSKYCSDTCRYHAHLVTKKRITIPRDQRFSILYRDGFSCRYCGARPPRKGLRVDHIVPVDAGGALTDPENLITACNDCNSGKSNQVIDESLIPPAPEEPGEQEDGRPYDE